MSDDFKTKDLQKATEKSDGEASPLSSGKELSRPSFNNDYKAMKDRTPSTLQEHLPSNIIVDKDEVHYDKDAKLRNDIKDGAEAVQRAKLVNSVNDFQRTEILKDAILQKNFQEGVEAAKHVNDNIEAQSNEIGNAVKSGSIEDIQSVLAEVDTPAEYADLKKDAEEFNRNAPVGLSMEVTMVDGKPQVEIIHKVAEPSENVYVEKNLLEIQITEDSVEAVRHPRHHVSANVPVQPAKALDEIQNHFNKRIYN